MIVEVRKAVLLFLTLFVAWHFLYCLTWVFPLLSDYWLLAYLIVFGVEICYFILDGQKASDLGIAKTKAYKRYITVGLIFALSYNFYLIAIGAAIFSLEPSLSVQYGLFTVLYNALLALTIGVVEESAFRGYILRNLAKAYSDAKAIALSSLLFGIYHLSFVYIFTSPMSMYALFFWVVFVLFAFSSGIFLGCFYLNSEKTTVGTTAYHSTTIFIGSLIPFNIAAPQIYQYILGITFYIIAIPVLLILFKRKHFVKRRI